MFSAESVNIAIDWDWPAIIVRTEQEVELRDAAGSRLIALKVKVWADLEEERSVGLSSKGKEHSEVL